MINFRRRRRASKRYFSAIESLEQRQLLTVDLAGAFTVFPNSPVLSGSKQPVTLHLTNLGTTKATGSLTVNLYASPDGVALDVLTATPMGSVNAGLSINASGSQDVSFPLLFNPALAAGDYQVFAVLDPLNKIVESNETNNTFQSAVFTVSQPDYDLVPTFGTTTIPSSLIAGDLVNGSAQIILTNPSTSTATIGAGISVGVDIVARAQTASDDLHDIVINKTALNAVVGGLAPGKTKIVAGALQFATLPAGSYIIVAKVDPDEVLSETNDDNNEVILGATVVTVGQRTTNLALTVDSGTKLPLTTVISDGIKTIPLKFDVTVSGNRPTTATQKVTLAVSAHPHAGGADIPLGTFSNLPLGAVQVGNFKAITVSPTLPFGMSTNQYDFVAVMTSDLASDLVSDNSASTATALVPLAPLSVTRGNYDLQLTIASTTLPLSIVQGVPKTGVVKLDVTNIGNVLLPAVQHVNLAVFLRPSTASNASQDIPVGTLTNQSVAKLAASGKKSFSVNATTSSIAADNYTLIATLTPVEAITEELLSNNSVSGATVAIQTAFIDLDIATATDTYAASVLGGAIGNGSVTVANLGNVPAQGTLNVQFLATTTGNIADGVPIGTKAFPINLLNGKTSSTLTVALTLPTGASSHDYTIISQIIPSGFTDSATSNNIQNVSGIIHAAPATIDVLVNSSVSPFGANAVGGATATANFTIGNLGTIPAAGSVTVTYYATADGSLNAGATNGTAVGSTTVQNLNIGSNSVSAVQHVQVTLPNPASTTSLHLFARVTGSSFTDNNTANNETSIGTVSTSHLTSVFPVDHGDVLTFHATSTIGGLGNFVQDGTFTTNKQINGHAVHGTYHFTYINNGAGPNILALTFAEVSPSLYGMTLSYSAAGFLVGGKTLTFSFDPTGAKGFTTDDPQHPIYFK